MTDAPQARAPADIRAWCDGGGKWVGAPRVCVDPAWPDQDLAGALGSMSMDGVKSKVRLALMERKDKGD